MKKRYFALLIVSLATLLMGCDVEQTQEGKMPKVDVDVTEGQLPKYDVDAPDVDVSMEEKVIEVPDVDVTMEKETISVPDIDVDMPRDD